MVTYVLLAALYCFIGAVTVLIWEWIDGEEYNTEVTAFCGALWIFTLPLAVVTLMMMLLRFCVRKLKRSL